jgi:hypothetical protein
MEIKSWSTLKKIEAESLTWCVLWDISASTEQITRFCMLYVGSPCLVAHFLDGIAANMEANF